MPSSTGNVRSARKMPPIPIVSAMVWLQAERGRDVEVGAGGVDSADLDGVDDEVGAVESRTAVEVARHRGRRTELARRRGRVSASAVASRSASMSCSRR